MSQPIPRMSSLFRLEYPQSVGVYGTYDEAQSVVDFLADSRFPVENLCIVGTELKSIERVLGRRSWGTVIGQGVQSGLSTGLMITLIVWIFMPTANIVFLALSALAIGIFVGILMAALGYWMSQGKRDFRSVSQTMATKYEVLAEHKVAGSARELIGTMPGARAAAFNPAQAGASAAQAAPPQAGTPGYPAGYGQVPGYGQAPAYGQQYPPGYPQGQPYQTQQQYPAPAPSPYAGPPQQPAPEPAAEPPVRADDEEPKKDA